MAGAVHAAEIDRARIIALAGSVLKVESVRSDGRLSIGTAVSVAPGRFVTNCHVTRDAELVVLVRGGVRWRVDAQRADLYFDLCMLDVSGLRAVPWVPLATARELRVGDAVAAAGYTGGAGLQMHVGTVNALHALHGSKVIQSTTAFTSGASGGALFDAEGRLAGILTFRLRGADGFYFAAPVDWIADRLDDTEGYVPIGPLSGRAPFWSQPLTSLPFFLQAASLSRDAQWTALVALTDDWIAADRDDAEAWTMRASGLVGLAQDAAAIDALRRAVELDPRYVQAWSELGRAYVRTGAIEPALGTARMLDGLDPVEAAALRALAAAPAR